ncbi:MAG: hypothetical protein Q8R00_03590 [Candidatus Nanoarchaeia archaeon]|nr:hypothetical protein [Candidatus Nanoarchaeia archaeon]
MNKPIKKWRSGAIEGCIWANARTLDNGTEVEFKTATLTRSYKKKGDDVWRSETFNFRRSDIPKIQAILHNLQQELFLVDREDEDNE